MLRQILTFFSIYLIAGFILSMNAPGYAAASTDITFASPVILTTSLPGERVIRDVVDIDNDGHLDIVLSDTATFMILYGHGDGTFTSVTYPATSSANLEWCAVADYNKDGMKDIAFNSPNTNKVYVFLATGPRTFGTPIGYPVGSSPSGISSGDFNGDGYPDIVTANGGSSDISVILNNMTGAFNAPANYGAGQFAKSVVATNLRNNGIIDIVDSNAYQNWSPVYFGDGLGNFVNVPNSPTVGGGHLVADDFNNDGFTDLAGADYWNGRVGVSLNNGLGYFPSTNVYTTNGMPVNIKSGDLNGDGTKDLVVGHLGYSDGIGIYLNDGTGNMIAPQYIRTSGVGQNTGAVGDFNEDGKPDIVADGWDYHLIFFFNTTIPLIASATPDPATPNGQNGWYTMPVQVMLNASSSSYTPDQLPLYYTVNSGATQSYTNPFNLVTDGQYQLSYWTQSPTGATSVPKPLAIKIDQTPPVTTLSVKGPVNGSDYGDDVSVTLSATDNTNGSGVAATHYTIDSGTTQDYTSAFNVTGSGSHTITYWSLDRAGNAETVNSTTINISYFAPTISSTTPTTVQALSTFMLVVDGTNFRSGAQISWNGTLLTTNFISSTELTTNVPVANNGALPAYPQQCPVIVTNPDTKTSNTAYVTITKPLPYITSLSPTSVPGEKTFTLTVNGTNFVSGSIIKWNGTNIATTYVSSTQLTASINKYYTTLSSYPGSATVSVLNPDGGRSSGATLTITQPIPVPTISSLSPSSVIGAKTFTLTVNGSNFVSGSIIKYNGTNMTTTYVSATQLTASINKYYTTLSSYPGSVTISVLNPDGNRSTGATLTITAPLPAISSLSPSSVPGKKTFTLTVNGSNFVSGSIIKYNGTNMTTTYVSSTQLTASINMYYTTLSSYPGSATISVLNPDGGRAAGATLTITAPVP